jgi:hypothetical protein
LRPWGPDDHGGVSEARAAPVAVAEVVGAAGGPPCELVVVAAGDEGPPLDPLLTGSVTNTGVEQPDGGGITGPVPGGSG